MLELLPHLPEAEFTTIVAGSSEALFVKRVVEFMLEAWPKIKARSDSLAASSRQGVGRVRRIDSDGNSNIAQPGRHWNKEHEPI